MKRLTKTLSLLLALALCLTLCACGSATSSAASSAKRADYAVAPQAAYSNAAYEASWDEAMDMEAAVGGFGVATAESGAEADAPEADPEKIIYSANVTLESTEFESALAQVEALTKEVGGWIESSSINGANFNDAARGYSRTRSASYTLRIPSARFEQVMNTLPQIGNVPYSHRYSENVTAQYYDVQAHMNAYKTQEARLLELMEKAETVEDVILLESRLSELRYQIDSLQSTLNNWDRRVSYSTINLELNEVRVYTPEPEVRRSFGEELFGALKDGVENALAFLKGLLLWLVEALPTLIVLAPIVWLVVWLIGRLRRRARAKKAAKAASPAATAPKGWKARRAAKKAQPEQSAEGAKPTIEPGTPAPAGETNPTAAPDTDPTPPEA